MRGSACQSSPHHGANAEPEYPFSPTSVPRASRSVPQLPHRGPARLPARSRGPPAPVPPDPRFARTRACWTASGATLKGMVKGKTQKDKQHGTAPSARMVCGDRAAPHATPSRPGAALGTSEPEPGTRGPPFFPADRVPTLPVPQVPHAGTAHRRRDEPDARPAPVQPPGFPTMRPGGKNAGPTSARRGSRRFPAREVPRVPRSRLVGPTGSPVAPQSTALDVQYRARWAPIATTWSPGFPDTLRARAPRRASAGPGRARRRRGAAEAPADRACPVVRQPRVARSTTYVGHRRCRDGRVVVRGRREVGRTRDSQMRWRSRGAKREGRGTRRRLGRVRSP